MASCCFNRVYIYIYLLFNIFNNFVTISIFPVSTRSKSLTSDLNEEGSSLKTSPRQNSQSVTTLQKTLITNRSPFSIRRVKPVKPEKLPSTTNNNNDHVERSASNASKKRSYFRRKSVSQGNSTWKRLFHFILIHIFLFLLFLFWDSIIYPPICSVFFIILIHYSYLPLLHTPAQHSIKEYVYDIAL